jgi:dTDP-glucose pyrophosphorylase
MAGKSSRFFDQGYHEPKFKLIANDKSIFEWSMLSLRNLFCYKFIFISQKQHDVMSFINEKCESLSIKNFTILEIDFFTKGQAETVSLAREFIKGETPILIYNIDTYVSPECILDNDFHNLDGLVYTVPALGDQWSFFSVDKNGRILDAKEKVRISNHASIGLYYFSNWDMFADAYESSLGDENIERYISNLYKFLKSKDIYIKEIELESFFPLGTPEDFVNFCQLNINSHNS